MVDDFVSSTASSNDGTTVPSQVPRGPRFPGHFQSDESAMDLNHDGVIDEDERLQDAALSVPDADAMSVSSLHTTSTDRAADEETAAISAAAAEAQLPMETDDVALDTSASVSSTPTSSTRRAAENDDTTHDVDWHHLLGLSGQGLSAANAATSLGFAAARQTTSISLSLVKRLTQGLIALPAMALDGTLGNTPSFNNYSDPGRENNFTVQPTIASVAHSAVGGLFDVISALAVGGIDIGTAVTGAGLGAAVSGVEGVRRALGSEVIRSLGAFSRLVRREWNSSSAALPPGGIPQYSILGVTQALTAWVCIQTITREYYETRMLKNLDVVDLEAVHATLQAAKEEKTDDQEKDTTISQGETAHANVQDDEPPVTAEKKSDDNKKKRKKVRILDDVTLPGDEGEIIDAEIGEASAEKASAAGAVPTLSTDATSNPEQHLASAAPAPQALTDAEAIAGLKRYSRLVLGVYGGVALAWLGSLPPDLMQAAGTSIESEQQAQGPGDEQQASRPDPLLMERPRGRSASQVDQSDFLRAAASLDLDDSELIDDEADSVMVSADEGEASGTATPKVSSTSASSTDKSSTILFSSEDEGFVAPASLPAASQSTPASAPGRSYSYYDVLMGSADADIFHRLGGLEDGQAREGDYTETSSQAGSAAERLRRVQNRVARPSKPRYYVVTDHTQRKIVLVLRGSLSLGDIAIDLTCESANFDIHAWDVDEKARQAGSAYPGEDASELGSDGPASAEDFSKEALEEKQHTRAHSDSSASANTATGAEERRSTAQARSYERSEYIVHEGMYETAKEIGEPGRPVHRAVRRALLAYPDYALDITGHSLGAGVAALLAIMWASPATGKTTIGSGLPAGRTTHAYSFAVPCVMGAKLGKRAEPLVTSYCYSYDLVCRLSLGAILDIRNACAWLAYENKQSASPSTEPQPQPPSQHYGLARPLRLVNIMQRAFMHQSGRLTTQQQSELEADFLALRKTLEANMTHVELYPPGTVLYSLAPEDVMPHIEPAAARHQVQARQVPEGGSAEDKAARKATLYRLRPDGAREDVFGQIIHCRGMLSRHMPHLYHYGIDVL